MEDCSTDERLRQETLCRRQWTDEYVERPETQNGRTAERQNVVVVWLQCLLVDVVRHAGKLAPDQFDIVRQNCDLVSGLLRSLQPVKSAEQRADLVEPLRPIRRFCLDAGTFNKHVTVCGAYTYIIRQVNLEI